MKRDTCANSYKRVKDVGIKMARQRKATLWSLKLDLYKKKCLQLSSTRR